MQVRSKFVLPFEKPVLALENKLDDLRAMSADQHIDVAKEIERMERKIADTRRRIYGNLSPWDRIQIARHPDRPYPRDYIRMIMGDFVELHGDRLYGDDRAIVGGFATLADRRIMLVGTQKGRDTKSNLECNFGSPFPEGYRKALRLFKLADKFGLPIVALIDTPGAFPGVESEERHVAEAIAVNLRESFAIRVPMVAVITGEGGSGGALGLSVADRILILEHAYYSVITPEGCAAILWKDRAHADRAAEALKLTAHDLLDLGISDGIVSEPPGGAHNDPPTTAQALEGAIVDALDALRELGPDELLERRYQKFRAMGQFTTAEAPLGAAEAEEPPADPGP
jgi:acetyl-CoA carboxylase carboxyl transferase subunit alpha